MARPGSENTYINLFGPKQKNANDLATDTSRANASASSVKRGVATLNSNKPEDSTVRHIAKEAVSSFSKTPVNNPSLGGKYDETVFRNKNGPGNGSTNTVPSKLIGAQQEAGTSRFDKSKLTLGNNPYTGQVGMFKDGQMLEPGSVRLSGGNLGGTPLPAGQSPFFMKSEAAKGLVPQAGTASAIPGMQQNPVLTTPGGNMTGIMNQETAMLSAAMGQGMKPGQYQDFSKSIGMNPSTPGGDAAFRSIEAQIADLTNMNKQLAGGYGQSTEMGGWSKTKRTNMIMQNTDQIRQLNDSLTGRSTLANDLVKALLAAQTEKETTAMTANAGTERERIKAGADITGKQIDAGATVTAGANTVAATQQKEKSKLSLDALGKLAEPFNKKMERGEALTPEEEEQYKSIQQQISMYAYADGGDDNLPAMPSFGSK